MQDLSDCHLAAIPVNIPMKTDSTCDLELVFMKRCQVQFSQKKGTWKGRWCTLCKYVSNILKKKTAHYFLERWLTKLSKRRECLYASWRSALCMVPILPAATTFRDFHFEEYKQCVEAAKPKLEVHHAALPQWYFNQFAEKKPGEQQTELKFWPKGEVAVSTREGRLMVCVQYIIVENQVCWLTCGKVVSWSCTGVNGHR